VLLLTERIDEWVMGQLSAYEGKRFKDAARGDLELGALASEDRQETARCGPQGEQGTAQARQGCARERVTEARVSERLRESPVPGARRA
jgi:molecular chaperone HtpG